jgi:hypothetical protein
VHSPVVLAREAQIAVRLRDALRRDYRSRRRAASRAVRAGESNAGAPSCAADILEHAVAEADRRLLRALGMETALPVGTQRDKVGRRRRRGRAGNRNG